MYLISTPNHGQILGLGRGLFSFSEFLFSLGNNTPDSLPQKTFATNREATHLQKIRMYAQQPYIPDPQKQIFQERLPIYNRRGFATFVHVLIFIASMMCALAYISLLLLGSVLENNPNLKGLAETWTSLFPTYYFVILIIECLVIAITSIIAITSSKFLHRDQSTVLMSLLPVITIRALTIALACYYKNGFSSLYWLILDVWPIFGMLQGSKDNCLASMFVPFRKQ